MTKPASPDPLTLWPATGARYGDPDFSFSKGGGGIGPQIGRTGGAAGAAVAENGPPRPV